MLHRFTEKLLGKNKKNKGGVEASLSLSAHLLQRGSVKTPVDQLNTTPQRPP